MRGRLSFDLAISAAKKIFIGNMRIRWLRREECGFVSPEGIRTAGRIGDGGPILAGEFIVFHPGHDFILEAAAEEGFCFLVPKAGAAKFFGLFRIGAHLAPPIKK
jgi:hypothetical protein